MNTNPIENQFTEAFKTVVLNHGLLSLEITKAPANFDSLFEYADKLRNAVEVMRILDGILERQAEADALATPVVRA